jgi:transposase-like protein
MRRSIKHLTEKEKKERAKRYKEITMGDVNTWHKVMCKCLNCGKLHEVEMTAKPLVMPRVYCKDCEYLRGHETITQYEVGRGVGVVR